MARLQWFAEEITLEAIENLSFRKSHTVAFYDMVGGGRIVMTGKNLTADPGDPEVLASGKVEQIVFKDAEGETSAVLKGNYSAAKIGEAASGGGGGIFYDVLFNGDDTITGSRHSQSLWGGLGDDEIFAGGGRDIVFGQSGDDRVAGGKGSDTFLFSDYLTGADRDVILDLDIKGKDADVLLIQDTVVEKIRSVNKGEDTRLLLDNGATILIKDVTRAEFIDYWDVT